uniref:Uncharacterized protein n=1 Tax=viral metagenome TaxID=1070528 RepID=A0A6C0ILC8_9ZZZZ
MYEYDWKYFPARLHTTKEIINFLENIDNIQTLLNNNPPDLSYHIFGGINHPGVINDSITFMNTTINKNIKKLIL